jgi:general stress protein YciG
MDTPTNSIDQGSAPATRRNNRGNFASDPARAAAAGRKGGLSVAAADRSFARNPSLAAEAGRKGGQSVPASSRSFSQDRSLAAEAGRKGGQASHGGRNAEGHANRPADGAMPADRRTHSQP